MIAVLVVAFVLWAPVSVLFGILVGKVIAYQPDGTSSRRSRPSRGA